MRDRINDEARLSLMLEEIGNIYHFHTDVIHSDHRFSASEAENGGLALFKVCQTTKNGVPGLEVVV